MEKQRHIESLDGLRGVAALAVVFTHLPLIFPQSPYLARMTAGGEAVSLFFSLSGFLMAYLYGGKPFSQGAALDYLLHRFARIYPIYFVAVVFTALVSLLPYHFPALLLGAKEIARHLTMLGSTGVFWSIPPEIQFYFLFLLLWFWFDRPVSRAFIGLAIAAAFVFDWILGFPGPGILLPSKMEYFLMGAVAGRLFGLLPFRRHGTVVGVAALLAVILHFVLYKVFLDGDIYWGMTSALSATVAVTLVAFNAPPSAALLSSRPLRFLGRISFSLYLFHMPVMFLLSLVLPTAIPMIAQVGLCVGLSIAFATMTFQAIERPARQAILSIATRKCAPTQVAA
ncbi:acyltransferase family protein [Oryzifoliimicrobium ureilyticus]|uniref:acyltransferase family protein n=1 Tax=Oryzifoliimicrobium ureilyticus TaxID=3113724 RepID=UPI0030765B32